jgi:hypothetical protein
MSDSAGAQAPKPAAPSASEAGSVSPIVRSAARWFWWIAGLSVVNIVLFQSGSRTNFVVGLGITAISDVVFASNKAIGFVIDALAVGFFLWMGAQGSRGKLWAFYVGLAVYTLDALIYVSFKDWMPVAFHALAIFFIMKGVMVLRQAPQKTV